VDIYSTLALTCFFLLFKTSIFSSFSSDQACFATNTYTISDFFNGHFQQIQKLCTFAKPADLCYTFRKGRCLMEQVDLYENVIKKQEERIQEMERIIALLEEENALQKELINQLQKENAVLEKYANDYAGMMKQMIGDLHS